ncbi:hypothetical protein IPM09_00670 [Candidatus Saccharibacteria bacterium]|nr:MAG: hypothetical protein IPM09_00670 [Candidatus Saccharibacteria bacterium]
MTNVIILLMAVGLLVAAIRATSSTPERVIFALLGAAGIGFVGWAQVTGFVLPPITLSANWPLVAAVLTFAFIGAGISTGSSRWSALGVLSFTWLLWLLLGFSWTALALVAVGVLLALMFSAQQRRLQVNRVRGYRWFAAGTLVALLAGATVAVNTIDGRTIQDRLGVTAAIEQANAQAKAYTDALEAKIKTELDGMKLNPDSWAAYCAIPANSLPCAKIDALEQKNAEQDKTITALQSSDTKQWAAMLKAGVVAIPADADTDAMAKALADAFAKAGYTNVRIGNNVDWTLPGANQRYAGAFGQQTLRSQTMWVEYINSPAGAAARQNLLDRTPTELHDRFLSGKGLVPWQAMEKSCTIGNWSLVDGKSVQVDHEVCHDVGDVWWTPVGPDGTVYMAASTRAACRNPHTSVTPYPVGHTPKVCPVGSDRASQPIANGCWNKHPLPKKVPVCTLDGTKIIWVLPTEAGKYPKPNSAGNCSKMGSDLGLNPGEGGSGGVNGNNGATDSRGLQNDPAADAKAAADKAAADAKAAEEQANQSTGGASTDSGQGGNSGGQSSGSPTGDGGNQGGDDIWGGN